MKTMATDRKGVIAPMTGLVAALLIGFVGMAVDTTRAWLVEARMRSALDAAALVAARRFSEATRDAEARGIFWANIQQGGRARNWLGATIDNPTIAVVSNNTGQIRVSTSATVPVTLFRIISRDNIVRTAAATAQRAGTGLEVAIALDVTTSMGDCASGSRSRPPCDTGVSTNIQLARAAINNMVDVLYAGQERQPNLYVAVVPFARTINIGNRTETRAMLDTTGAPAQWAVSGGIVGSADSNVVATMPWNGCIMATRANNVDITDAAPTGTNALRPYIYPSTYQQVGTLAANNCTIGNAYPARAPSTTRWCAGDNDWTFPGRFNASGGAVTATDATMQTANAMYFFLRGTTGGLSATTAAGPNLLCPSSPIQPLTAIRTDVRNAVNNIDVDTRSAGTHIVTGMLGAWYTLSPNFQNRWWNPNSALTDVPTLPRSHTTANNTKAIVIVTDGEENWQYPYTRTGTTVAGTNCTFGGTSTSNSGVCASLNTSTWFQELLYGPYGRARDWNTTFVPANTSTSYPSANIVSTTGTNSGTPSTTSAESRMADRFTAACNAIKATAGNGIQIYVIGFGVPGEPSNNNPPQVPSSATSEYGRAYNCASTRDGRRLYYSSPTANDLAGAFARVAAELVSLRLVD